ncbi:hypothetical protein H072_10004 [Dactylellina haptotyla CBS 200.50]|uniref:Uncharacterized protein n=1 Tax=Dactylellina haptotyla (strain CBS 200.50) TaxID=1284197 RepID=S8A0F1_DACHA|nr:hypothetical protein H072_10004 [Dactylellina haptotyla CBS 200.50]
MASERNWFSTYADRSFRQLEVDDIPLPPYSPLHSGSSTCSSSDASSTPECDRKSCRSINLPCIDIEQLENGKSEGQLLLEMLDSFHESWPAPHVVTEKIKTSLLTTLAIYDDVRAPYASSYGGGRNIYRIVGRFRRNRRRQRPVDLCLVLWKEMHLSEREKCTLLGTHRYAVKDSSEPDEFTAAVDVKWHASWEPTCNLPPDQNYHEELSATIAKAKCESTLEQIPHFEILLEKKAGSFCDCSFFD